MWRRDALCAWHVELDGGVTGTEPVATEAGVTPQTAAYVGVDPPPGSLITANALNHALEDFQRIAQSSGAAAAFRTYLHNGAVRLYVDALPPLDGPGAIDEYLLAHPVKGVWQEKGHGRSADATMAYTTGEIYDEKSKPAYAFVQIWVYDAKVSNWGLRLLLLSRIASR